MRLILCLGLLLLTVTDFASAQRRIGATVIYPDTLYPGENVITISNDNGIEKIRYRATSKTTVVVPAISGCPKKVELRVRVGDATGGEAIDLTLYDCAGAFLTQTIKAENWTIRQENTGRVEIGTDTCVRCEINTTNSKLVDSIVTSNPSFSVRMPPGRGPWLAVGDEFIYHVCYKPTKPEQLRETIRLYIRRGQPNAGLTHYVIEKPILATGVLPPPPKEEPPAVIDTTPPLEDPTTFRNIVMPTAESLGENRFFIGNYELAGWLAGYGATDELTLMFGAAAVPEFISRLLVVTAGGKYEVLKMDLLNAAVGFQYGFSSTQESDISVAAPYAVVSFGNKRNRISISGGYSWKHHKTKKEGEFDRNAYILGVGGDITLTRGWKLAMETYAIESSGLAPVVMTARYFQERFAFDAGLGVDLAGGNEIRGTGTFSGEISDLRIAPVLSFIWKW